LDGRRCLRLSGNFTAPSAVVVVRGVLARFGRLHHPIPVETAQVSSAADEVWTCLRQYPAHVSVLRSSD
jgi:anti-anti-sigma factor